MDRLEIEKELARLINKEYLASPGRYRVLMWDRWEWSSSSYTLEEALTPTIVREFDDAEEALQFARSQPSNGGFDEYSVFDEYGRYLGGNFESRGPKPSPVLPKTPAPFTERLDKAFAMARDLHKNQYRKGTKIPYLSHLLAVVGLVIENGGDEDEAIAALLHDAVEDQGGKPTLEKIRQQFGERVTMIVEGCTDTDEDSKPPWKPRKKEFLERLAKAPASVKLVSSADKLHNARSLLADYRAIGGLLWSRFNAPKSDLLWYQREVTEVLKKSGSTRIIEELDRVVTELERLAT